MGFDIRFLLKLFLRRLHYFLLVALPVAGLMALDPFEAVRDRLVELRAAARSLGVVLEEPFLQLAFLALPVIPHLKITDHGLVDVDAFAVIAG